MPVSRVSSPVDIAISGLRAEALRMKITAENIANARTTRTEAGGPYRRKSVVLSAGAGVGGVEVGSVTAETSGFLKKVYMPGHPDADEDGMVGMPNIDLPVEMINMMIASRAYQANAAILKRYQDMVNATLELLR